MLVATGLELDPDRSAHVPWERNSGRARVQGHCLEAWAVEGSTARNGSIGCCMASGRPFVQGSVGTRRGLRRVETEPSGVEELGSPRVHVMEFRGGGGGPEASGG